MSDRLVLVEWIDSRGVGSRWATLKDIADDEICSMRSVGWVLKDDDKQLCVGPHMGVEDDGDHQVCGEMHIPKVCVTRVVELETPNG